MIHLEQQERVRESYEGKQLPLFDHLHQTLDSSAWHGSFNGRESSLQQLAPYVGKLKSGMVRVLLDLFSRPDDSVLDPFSGSGVVPLEAVLSGRKAIANDLSPYAYTLTKGKLEAPVDLETALTNTQELLCFVDKEAAGEATSHVPDWIQAFYHPDTLKEIVAAFRFLKAKEDNFLTACLLGIMHHVRPGFLSYPASHLVPYLRIAKYPPNEYPKMYEYRDLRSRLISKVKRAYKRSMIPPNWSDRIYTVFSVNSMSLPIVDKSVDTIVTSPPYYGALDYARDNRLRLWFLGCEDWKGLDKSLTANNKVYVPQMAECIKEMYRVLRNDSYCILVLGDVERDGKTHRTAEVLSELAAEVTGGGFVTEQIYDDRIPDERRTRRQTKTTKFERILVMKKTVQPHSSQ